MGVVGVGVRVTEPLILYYFADITEFRRAGRPARPQPLTSVVPEVAAFQFTSTRPLLIAADILLRLMPMPALATESRRSEASTVLTCSKKKKRKSIEVSEERGQGRERRAKRLCQAT